VVLLLVACGYQAPPSKADSGVPGGVVSEPQCPVVITANPCPDLLVPGIVVSVSALEDSV
jgi:hypothetical protein